MEVKVLFFTLIIIIFLTENIIPRFRNLHRFLIAKQKPESAICMGLTITFIITISSFSTYLVNKYLFIYISNNSNKYLSSIIFFLLIIVFAQLFKIVTKKYNSKFYKAPNYLSVENNFFPNLMINCAIMGASIAILNIKYGFIAVDICFLKILFQAIFTGSSFTIILLLFAGIRERLEFAEIPEKLKGFFISLIVAGLLAMAFYGFSGIIF